MKFNNYDKPKEITNWIEGAKVIGKSSIFHTIWYPATNEIIEDMPEASIDQVNEAVEASSKAQKEWMKLSSRDRGRLLVKASQLIRKNSGKIAEWEVWDTGKPISEAIEVDVVTGADALEFYGNLAISLHGDYYNLPEADVITKVEPLGVCAGIGAWNYPFQIACWKSAPALASGNSFIFKPSELTPITALLLAEIYEDAGLPPGLFQVLQGGAVVGQFITKHPKIQKVSFTGEVGTGKKIMSDASANLKHLTMELGGKSPLIIFPDTNPETAAKAALAANFYTQGEVCTNGTRVFVHEEYLDKFKSSLDKRKPNVKLGDPFSPDTNVGSLISKNHKILVEDYIKSGIEEGAVADYWGKDPDGEFSNGNFVRPVIFYNCNDSMKIVQEEIFGPVMSVLTFRSEEEVIERSNNTEFGLAAGIFTKDINRIQRMMDELEAGIVWINNYNITPMEMPFGGCKQSGFGKENGLDTFHHYTKRKSIYISKTDVFSPF